jgi:hypothetical protein
MAVTRYQFRLSVYLSTVVVTALVAASPRLIAWIVRTPRDYVSVEIDGKLELFDPRVWLPRHVSGQEAKEAVVLILTNTPVTPPRPPE